MNELDLRRPDFDPNGVPIKLADGQNWTFPLPLIELSPRFDGAEVTLGSSTSFGPDHDALIEAATKAEGILDELKTTWALAASMLRRQYNLDNGQLGTLLRYRKDEDGESQETINAILRVAFGNPPKASPVGDA